MTDEPYRWLEAIANRREYIRDQFREATPVLAVSRPEGIVLMGVGTGQSKVFELYDRLAMAAMGNPVDIERVRQTTIEAAHLEGFTRDPEDVTARRLLNFSICPALKNSFEQIFAAPLLVEMIVAEVALEQANDVLARVSYDGTARFLTGGIAVVHTSSIDEAAALEWLASELTPTLSLKEVAGRMMAAWRSLVGGSPFVHPTVETSQILEVSGRTVEVAILSRHSRTRATYKPWTVEALA